MTQNPFRTKGYLALRAENFEYIENRLKSFRHNNFNVCGTGASNIFRIQIEWKWSDWIIHFYKNETCLLNGKVLFPGTPLLKNVNSKSSEKILRENYDLMSDSKLKKAE